MSDNVERRSERTNEMYDWHARQRWQAERDRQREAGRGAGGRRGNFFGEDLCEEIQSGAVAWLARLVVGNQFCLIHNAVFVI